MARNGSVSLNNAVVISVLNVKSGTSRIVASKTNQAGTTYTVTIESAGAFPDGMELRPDDTIDVTFAYDPKVKA